MCDPVTATVLSVGSTAMSAIGAYGAAQGQKAQMSFQSKLAKNNAIIAENNAKYETARAADATERGAEEVRNLNRRIAAVRSGQRDAFAGGGVTVDTGSPLDALADTEYLGKIDTENTLANAGREAAGYMNNANNLRAEAAQNTAQSSMYLSAKKNISPLFAATASALGGASSISGSFANIGGGSSKELPWRKAGYVNP